jgi:HK97 family phage major capsid protein
MDELEIKIQKMLEDVVKGLATKAEVTKAIDEEVAKKMAENEHLKETQTAIEELKGLNDGLANQVRQLTRSHFAGIRTPSGLYNGMWGDLETAKLAGLFILASIFGNKKASEELDNRGIELKRFTEKDEKAMGEDVGSTGGVLVPTELIPNIILLIEKYGVFRRNVLEYPMASDSALAPKLSSGLTVYCPGAGVAPTTSDAAFKSVGLNAKKWMTLTALDSELNEDAAIAIGELIGFLIGQAFAQKEDEVGFLGDGTSTYFGHTGIAGALRAVDATIANIKSLVVGAGNAYSELTLANFDNVCGIVPDYADNGDLKWYCSRMFYYTVMVRLAMAAGGANATEILSGSVSREKTFLGYPLEFAQAMPKTEANSQVCAILGNLRLGAYLGDRRKLTIDRSTEAYFTTDQLGIRGTERVAPTVHGVGDTTNAGPICGLITAAS